MHLILKGALELTPTREKESIFSDKNKANQCF